MNPSIQIPRLRHLLLLSCLAACAGSDEKASDTADTDGGADTDPGTADTDGTDTDDTDTGEDVRPTVVSTAPFDGEIGVAINGNASAVFSEPMDVSTLTDATFTVTLGGVGIEGTVIARGGDAIFWPATLLERDSTYTATITTGARSVLGAALAEEHSWTFSTGDTRAPGLPVGLGTAEDFAILAKSGISTVPPSVVVGDVGISPAAATFLTGFSLTADPTNVFSTSPQVTGRLFAADFAPPTPAVLTTAVSDMELALTDAAGRAPDVTELGAGNVGGMTLDAGVYKWGTGLLIPTDVTLDGSATDVWIFQIAQDLTVSSGANVLLTGGAVPENVFWQVSGLVDLGTTSVLKGVVLSQTSITLRTGAAIDGRLLAQTAVDLDASTVVEPAP